MRSSKWSDGNHEDYFKEMAQRHDRHTKINDIYNEKGWSHSQEITFLDYDAYRLSYNRAEFYHCPYINTYYIMAMHDS